MAKQGRAYRSYYRGDSVKFIASSFCRSYRQVVLLSHSINNGLINA